MPSIIFRPQAPARQPDSTPPTITTDAPASSTSTCTFPRFSYSSPRVAPTQLPSSAPRRVYRTLAPFQHLCYQRLLNGLLCPHSYTVYGHARHHRRRFPS
jgi:hypothetical protein